MTFYEEEKKKNKQRDECHPVPKQINEITPTYLATESYFQDSEPEQN